MATAHNIGQYQFSNTDRLFFDTNIWFLLFDCRSDPDREIDYDAVKIYSGALRRLLKNQSQLFTHPFVVSEFVNRLLRDEHNFQRSLGKADNKFKLWRRSPEYRNYAEVVAACTRQLLERCELIEDNFDKPSLLKRLTYFEEDARDLNDEFIIEICERNELTLVTHDGDFGHSALKILTANPSYLRR